MALCRGAGPSALLVLALLGGCQANGAVDEPPQKGRPVTGAAAATSARVECGGECRVELFVGAALTRLTVASDGAVQVPAQGGVLFVAAAGRIPQVKFVGPDRPLETVRLEAAPDPRRGGYLAVAAVKVFTGGKRGGATRLMPVPGAELALLQGRARTVLVADQDGIVVTHLPANEYGVFVGGERHPVDVPQGGTAVLPLVITKVMVD